MRRALVVHSHSPAFVVIYGRFSRPNFPGNNARFIRSATEFGDCASIRADGVSVVCKKCVPLFDVTAPASTWRVASTTTSPLYIHNIFYLQTACRTAIVNSGSRREFAGATYRKLSGADTHSLASSCRRDAHPARCRTLRASERSGCARGPARVLRIRRPAVPALPCSRSCSCSTTACLQPPTGARSSLPSSDAWTLRPDAAIRIHVTTTSSNIHQRRRNERSSCGFLCTKL